MFPLKSVGSVPGSEVGEGFQPVGNGNAAALGEEAERWRQDGKSCWVSGSALRARRAGEGSRPSFYHCWQELALHKDRGPGTGPQPIPWHERWEHPARIQGWEWGQRELSRRLLSAGEKHPRLVYTALFF